MTPMRLKDLSGAIRPETILSVAIARLLRSQLAIFVVKTHANCGKTHVIARHVAEKNSRKGCCFELYQCRKYRKE